MMSASLHTRESGYTLVEVMAAVALLSIGLLAVLTATRAARETQQRALYISTGRAVAQSVIDELRSRQIESITDPITTTSSSSLPPGNSVQATVTRYPNGIETNLYKAVVTVAWPEGNGTRKVVYETLIARR